MYNTVINDIELPIKNNIQLIHKKNNNIISTLFTYTKYIILKKPVYSIYHKSFNHPLLIHIYNFLEEKLNTDLRDIIIKEYINIIDYMIDDKIKKNYSIDRYLSYEHSACCDYSPKDKKYYISKIYCTFGGYSKTYMYYNYNLKIFLDEIFNKNILFILDKYINNI